MVSINVRNKGKSGEREIANLLNDLANVVRFNKGLSVNTVPLFQRNQNQSAVGGSDLTNPLGLEIEVKRQESLNINSWWKQCLLACEQTGNSIPILIFRQNRKAWRVIMYSSLSLPNNKTMQYIRSEISLADFKSWFKTFYAEVLDNS